MPSTTTSKHSQNKPRRGFLRRTFSVLFKLTFALLLLYVGIAAVDATGRFSDPPWEWSDREWSRFVDDYVVDPVDTVVELIDEEAPRPAVRSRVTATSKGRNSDTVSRTTSSSRRQSASVNRSSSSSSSSRTRDRSRSSSSSRSSLERDMANIERDVVQSVLPVDDEAFRAAERMMNSKRGSAEHNRATGQLLRESTETTGRLLGRGAQDAARTVSSRDFWSGLSSKSDD